MKKTFAILIFSAILIFALGCASAYSFRLPDDLTIIEEQAFVNNAALEKVFLPPGLKRIEDHAFAGSGLNSIYSPDLSGIDIAENAFGGKNLFHFPLPGDHLSIVCGETRQIDFSFYPPPREFT